MSLADRLSQVTGTSAARVAGVERPAEEQFDVREQYKRQVHAKLVDRLGARLYSAELDRDALADTVFEVLQEILPSQRIDLSSSDRSRIVQEIIDDTLGLGPIEPLLRDRSVTEVMVNAFDAIFVERNGVIEAVPARFASERHLREIIDRIVSQVGRRVDESSPMVDARLPDGSRVNAIIKPIAVDGSSLTIRKFSKEAMTVRDLMSYGTLTQGAVSFLDACVRGRRNILISGGTGSGKTTTLNIISSFIPDNERVITIEDAVELQLKQRHVIRLESRPPNIEGVGGITIRDLVRNALRMRPYRIIVGEIRDAAALDMLQAMNTGHDGSLSTVHANTTRDALRRVETMVLMTGLDLPVWAIREQIAAAIHIVVQQARLRDGSRRILEIAEVAGLEGETIQLDKIFEYEFDQHAPAASARGVLKPTGIVPRCLEDLHDHGVEVSPSLFQVR
jgi:pilus assembly protein CpaF